MHAQNRRFRIRVAAAAHDATASLRGSGNKRGERESQAARHRLAPAVTPESIFVVALQLEVRRDGGEEDKGARWSQQLSPLRQKTPKLVLCCRPHSR